jgi:hypothetical protein
MIINKEGLSDVLNIEYKVQDAEVISSEVIEHDPIQSEPLTDTQEIEYDISVVRSNYHDIIESGKEMLNRAQEIAEQSEHPRALEVFSGLLKNLADINSQLLDVHVKKKEILEVKSEPQVNQVTNNTAVFVGTMTDLIKKIKDEAK